MARKQPKVKRERKQPKIKKVKKNQRKTKWKQPNTNAGKKAARERLDDDFYEWFGVRPNGTEAGEVIE